MSLTALLYMGLSPLLAKRYSVKVRYYAWLIIVIGLIIPFRPYYHNAVVKIDIPAQMTMPIVQIGKEPLANVPSENVQIPLSASGILWWQIMAAIWLAGMILFLSYHAIKHLVKVG